MSETKLLCTWSNAIPLGCQHHLVGEGQSTKQKLLRKLDNGIQKNLVGTLSYTTYEINSKWIKDVILRSKSIKLLEVNIQAKFLDVAFTNGLSDVTPKVQTTK